MLNLLQNGAFQWAIGTLIALLVGLGAIIGPYLLNRTRKRLFYDYLQFPILSRRLEDDRLALLFEGEKVPNVYASIIKLRYEGTASITEDEFRTSPTFTYPDADVLSADIANVSPKGIKTSVEVQDSRRVILSPTALNNNDQITIRVIRTAPSGPNRPDVESHIVGVSKIEPVDRDTISRRIDRWMPRISLALGLFWVAVSLTSWLTSSSWWWEGFFFLMMGLFLIALSYLLHVIVALKTLLE